LDGRPCRPGPRVGDGNWIAGVFRTSAAHRAGIPSTGMPITIPHVIPGDPLRISASTFVAWKRCPDQANAMLRGIYGPDSRPAFLGSLAHRIFSRHLNRGPIDAEEFDQACREEIGASTLNFKMGGLEIKPSSLSGMIEEVRGLYDRFVRFPGAGFEGSEVPLAHQTDGGVELVGKVDAIYREDVGGHRLVDWKTGELGDPVDQLRFYSLLWALERDEVPVCVEAVSVKTGESHRAHPTMEELEGVAAEVAAMAAEMRGSWNQGTALERRAGPWCRYCPILEECPEGQAAEALIG